VEDEEGGEDQEECGDAVIPFELFAQIGDGEYGEDAKGKHFLNRLELRGVEFVGADAVGGHLKAVFEKRYAPAGQHDFPQRLAAVFEVPVPGKGHEDVGNGEQSDGAQSGPRALRWLP